MDPIYQRWAAFDRRFNPAAPIPDHEFVRLYVPLPDGPARRLVVALEKWRASLGAPDPDPAPQFLFCGARGSGKSTQLQYIHRHLASDWEVIPLDMGPVLPERPGTLFFVALAGLVAAARLREHTNAPQAALARGTAATTRMVAGIRALTNIAADVEELIGAASALVPSLPGATGLAAGARLIERLLPLRPLSISTINDRVTVDRDAPASELLGAVNAVLEELHGAAGKPVLLLADGLDKANTADRALGLFDDAPLLRRLSAAFVLTGPVHLRHDHRILAVRQSLPVHLLFNVAMVDRHGAPRPAGVAVLEQIARHRLTDDLADSVNDDALAAAIAASSGTPRELFRILNGASGGAAQDGVRTITVAHVHSACRELRLLLQQTLTTEDLRLLHRVLKTARAGESDRERDLLYENYIACYANGDTWFRPHELLVGWIEQEMANVAQYEAPDGESGA